MVNGKISCVDFQTNQQTIESVWQYNQTVAKNGLTCIDTCQSNEKIKKKQKQN